MSKQSFVISCDDVVTSYGTRGEFRHALSQLHLQQHYSGEGYGYKAWLFADDVPHELVTVFRSRKDGANDFYDLTYEVKTRGRLGHVLEFTITIDGRA